MSKTALAELRLQKHIDAVITRELRRSDWSVVEAVAPKPVDVQLMKPGMRAAELGEFGVRRISVGDSIAKAA